MAFRISEAAKHDTFEAIDKKPRGVEFSGPADAVLLGNALRRLGVPYRTTPESDYNYELLS